MLNIQKIRLVFSRQDESLVDAKYTKNQAWRSSKDTLGNFKKNDYKVFSIFYSSSFYFLVFLSSINPFLIIFNKFFHNKPKNGKKFF